ncbi:MAG: glycosyltransferase family 4 protein [Chloroflexota bacterium]
MEYAGKVLIFVQNLPVPFDRRVWLESLALTERGYKVSVICPTGKHGRFNKFAEEIDGIHIYRYPAPIEAHGILGYIGEFSYCFFMAFLLSLWVWFRHGIDIVHACNPPETYFVIGAFYKLFNKKFVFDHHDLSPEMYLAKGGRENGILYRILLFLEKRTFKTADTVITTNQSHKQIAIERGGLAADNVTIVRSGPDFDRLQLLEPETELKDGHPYLVCYLGEMCSQDGVDLLLYVADKVRNQFDRKDIKFVLMGGGPELDYLRSLKSELGLDGIVELTGRVSDEDLCRYLSTADLCVDPDPYTEWSDKSTMNKIAEYMAFGKAIVAFELTENHYTAGDAALFVEPNDTDKMAEAIIELINDDKARQRMGTYGMTRVKEHLAWEYSIPMLYSAYDKVTKPSSPRTVVYPQTNP